MSYARLCTGFVRHHLCFSYYNPCYLQILAAAELLDDSPLNHSQASFLQTIQACGTSLVETVNHVLDFTKLSGNSKSGGVENVIVSTQYVFFVCVGWDPIISICVIMFPGWT